jgi:hypothetical protein
MSPRLTDHSRIRAGERCGWTPSTLQRMAPRILAEGIGRTATSGSLRRYLDKLVITHGKGDNLRLFGHDTFIFQGEVLITVMHLPARWHATVDKLRSAIAAPKGARA